MKFDNDEAKENSKELLKLFLIFFVATFLIWYLGGGPERWNKKFENVNLKENSPNILVPGVIKVKE